MSNLTDDESYYCFGYANKSVKREFKSFFRSYSTLEKAIDGLIYLDHNLYNKYTFVDNDVKYKLRAKASSQDDPVKVNESLLRWYSFVESSSYKSMGCVIEKLLMVRKQIIKELCYQACVNAKYPSLKELAAISHIPDMLNNDNNLQTNVNIHDEDENAPVQQNSDRVSLLEPKEKISATVDTIERCQNHKSAGSAENKSEHSVSEHLTEGGKSRELHNISKIEMMEMNEDKLDDEAVLSVSKACSADEGAKYTPAVETSDDFNLAVLDDSAIEQTSQQLKQFHLESDEFAGENNLSYFELASELVPEETTVPSAKVILTGELKLQESQKVDVEACEESDSWGTIIAISSDSESHEY